MANTDIIIHDEKDNVGVFGSVAETHRIFTVDTSFDRAGVSEAFGKWLNDNSPYHTAEYDSVQQEVRITYLQDASLFTVGESVSGTGFIIVGAVVEAAKTSNARYEEVDYDDWLNITSTFSGKLKPTESRPVYYRSGDTTLNFYPYLTKDIKHDYIKKPVSPKWSGVTEGNYFKMDSTIDFSLHPSEESSLVNKILELAGIALDELELSSIAIQSEAAVENDKNN